MSAVGYLLVFVCSRSGNLCPAVRWIILSGNAVDWRLAEIDLPVRDIISTGAWCLHTHTAHRLFCYDNDNYNDNDFIKYCSPQAKQIHT